MVARLLQFAIRVMLLVDQSRPPLPALLRDWCKRRHRFDQFVPLALNGRSVVCSVANDWMCLLGSVSAPNPRVRVGIGNLLARCVMIRADRLGPRGALRLGLFAALLQLPFLLVGLLSCAVRSLQSAGGAFTIPAPSLKLVRKPTAALHGVAQARVYPF